LKFSTAYSSHSNKQHLTIPFSVCIRGIFLGASTVQKFQGQSTAASVCQQQHNQLSSQLSIELPAGSFPPCLHQQLFIFSCTCSDSGAPARAKAPRKRAPKKVAPPDGDAQGSMSDTSCEEINVAGSESVKKVPKSRKKFKNELTIRLIAAAKAALAAPETGVQPHAIAVYEMLYYA